MHKLWNIEQNEPTLEYRALTQFPAICHSAKIARESVFIHRRHNYFQKRQAKS